MFLLQLLIIVVHLRLLLCLKCYACTGYVPCGNGQIHQMVNCPGKCLIYQNQFDSDTIIRSCCYSNCNDDGKGIFEGRITYTCSTDLCNSIFNDDKLITDSQEVTDEGSGILFETTAISTIVFSTTTTTTTTLRTSSASSLTLSCYDCTEYNPKCGTNSETIAHNCRMCMVYRNQYDGNTIVRRCCYSNCGQSNTVTIYEGRQTYFCSANLCNLKGSENNL